MSDLIVGVIGGSGLYEITGIENVEEVRVETPFGDPSDALITGTLEGVRCVFLPRHGRGHGLSPSEINFRANIWALKKLGVGYVLSISAVGSLREDIEPSHMICVDQFIDRTKGRPHTFFSDGIVAHVQFSSPVEENLRKILLESSRAVGATTHDGGTYVCIEGPTFSTRAESHLFRSWGASVVGMTNLPEARLAREAEMAYATLALSTDYDCWHEGEDEDGVDAVVAVIKKNLATAKAVIRETVKRLGALGTPEWPAHSALAGGAAVMTSPERISADARVRVGLLLGKHLWPEGR